MKILVIRLSSIGDIVICTPVVRALSQQLGAEVHFMTKKAFFSVLDGNPYISRMHEYEDHMEDGFKRLKKEKYDLVVDLHKNLRSHQIRRSLGIKSLTFDKLNLEKWLLVNFKWDHLPEGKHLVDRYFEALHPLGVRNDGEGLDFFINEEVRDLPDQPFATIALGAAHATKTMPVKLLDEILSRLSISVILIGGPSEKSFGDNLASRNSGIINLSGRCTIQQSASVIRRSRFLISPDTGMMHIGAALRKPLAVIWGNTVPAFGMFPYYGQYKVPCYSGEVGISCRPCSKIGYDKCPKGHFKCMVDQNVDALIDWCQSID